MSKPLSKKVIVVTGGTGVLGGSFVHAIAKAGGKVCVLGRNEVIAKKRCAEIETAGGIALPVICDVMQTDQLESACDLILKTFGRIDGLVNGAGGNIP